jgi:hypothetical protein
MNSPNSTSAGFLFSFFCEESNFQFRVTIDSSSSIIKNSTTSSSFTVFLMMKSLENWSAAWLESKCPGRVWARFSSHSQDFESLAVQASLSLFVDRDSIQVPS